MLSRIYRIFHPIRYQGARHTKDYFEGWYFKQTTAAEGTSNRLARAFAFIVGVSRSKEGDHAFIQSIDGKTGGTRYFRFPLSDFSTSDLPFEIRLGDNRFSYHGIDLELEDEDGRIEATLRFGPLSKPRRCLLSPGVMGPYSFAPAMECSHGIASMDHAVDGRIYCYKKDNQTYEIAFNGGRGYIEKDWGKSMPEAWIWLQSNSFDMVVGPASLSFSLARVPWQGKAFNGFICLLLAGGKEYRFASYTGACIDLLEDEGATVRILLSDSRYKMEILVRQAKAGLLKAPEKGAMARQISESLDSWMRVVLKRRRGSSDEIIYDATANVVGSELVGDLDSLNERSPR